MNAFRKAAAASPVLVLADDLDRADPAIAAQLRSIAYGCEASEALLVVATASTHVPTGGGQPVVGLGAVYAEWAAGTDPPAGDWAFAMTGIPLPGVPTGLAAPACPTPSAP